MLPDPIHPAVVHFPIVLAVLLPLSVLGALVAIRRGVSIRPVWSIPIALSIALTLSAWVSIETGEAQEDRVEAVVPERAIHTHEERAERFLALSGVVLLVLAGGLVGGTVGAASRRVGAVAAVLLLVPAAQVGSSGGALVYEHGAAAAYVTGSAGIGETRESPESRSPGSEAQSDDPGQER